MTSCGWVSSVPRTVFAASAPAKVNLHLGVGEERADGYHDLVTVFQAVDQRDQVRLIVEDGGASESSVVARMATELLLNVQLDEDLDTPANLAWRAVDAAVDAFRSDHPGAALPPVRIEVAKSIFVAGGMAGGSADAAAALVAANAYLEHFGGASLADDQLLALARQLGADVPFALMGGNALGTGRGDDLVAMLGRGEYWWLFINPGTTISTGKAFGLLDDMRHNNPALVPHLDTTRVAQALTSGDAKQLGAALHNDLQPAALAMRPRIKQIIDLAAAEGGYALVSGSGPTIAVLCEDREHAQRASETIREQLEEAMDLLMASGPADGARLEGER
ncbi:4-(cytidine 5'-diphospho)-2-C-methyl-D-erythritol kinase [Corynebacterium sp. CNCTC7651]|nr:4-(cytidine 5'-diphospho)-2-C-methyl-D-erythritol kinase [Corynebacterium sp. CNCTC7651]